MQRAIIITDLGYGDSGKGTMVAAYAQKTNAHIVVRFSGGAQAAHNVVTEDGRHHTFSQFGSATFQPGVRTHLSRFMLVYPPTLVTEERHLRSVGVTDAFDRLTIEQGAPLITPFHRAANWLRELARGGAEHGTCGMGIGETAEDVLTLKDDMTYASDLLHPRKLACKARRIRAYKREQLAPIIATLPRPLSTAAEAAIEILEGDDALVRYLEICRFLANRVRIVDSEHLGTLLARDGTVIFEGAQGVLLDEWFGFHPHTTWSTTTAENAYTLLREHHCADLAHHIGVVRAYATRHGAGPFVTEDTELTARLRDPHNDDKGWSKHFRVGWLDLVAVKYALEVVDGIDDLAVTCLDRIADLSHIKACEAYTYTGETIKNLDGFFRMSPDSPSRIENLRIDRSRNLVRQEQFTGLVKACRPIYCDVPREDYLRFLSAELRLPIVATSHGAATSDKQFHWRTAQ